jgi:glucose/arabinose dehydrogenase
VAENGAPSGGRLLRIDAGGGVTVMVDGLPADGDHQTNGLAASADGWIYFGVGTATNAGVVGEDSADFGWLKKHPQFHDVPGATIRLTGESFETPNPLTDDPDDRVLTGAFLPFGTPATEGMVIEGRTLCSGSVIRVPAAGGPPELVAWGLRNPFGLAFASDGALYATDNGYDERGSRRVWGSPDCLWRIEPGAWYGWPDFTAGRPLTDETYESPSGEALRFQLVEHPQKPPKPAARFACHCSADGLDFSRHAAFGHVGHAFVALFGDQTPATGKTLSPTGFKVVRVDPTNGREYEFLANRGDKVGPASWLGTHGLERPIAARFDPSGTALYVVDFGVVLQEPLQRPHAGTGVLWRVTREGAPPPPTSRPAGSGP